MTNKENVSGDEEQNEELEVGVLGVQGSWLAVGEGCREIGR